MRRGQTVYLTCTLSKSAFSGERVFRVSLTDGTDHIGVAPVGYCLHHDRSPLKGQEPASPIKGLVEGRVISNGGRIVTVAVPDGEVISVSLDKTPIFEKIEKEEYVPLRS